MRNARGLVFFELVVALALLSLIIGIATISLTGSVFHSKFQMQVNEFMTVLKMAQNAASQSDTRYAVLLDFDQRSYTLKPFFELDVDGIPMGADEMTTGYFTEDLQLEYVRFDDGVDTRNSETNVTDVYTVWLLAGQSGWQNTTQIGLLNADGYPYTVVLNRFSRTIEFYEGEYEIPEPVENVLF